MSRDSTYTQIHMHASHHADLFEEFCHPPSNTNTNTSSLTNNPQSNPNSTTNTNQPSDQTAPPLIPGQFLPFEEIFLPPHLMPINPEDEDDVVPDMHAAFGIQRALAHGQGGSNGARFQSQAAGGGGAGGEESTRGAQQEPIWRDLGLERMLESGGLGGAGDRIRGGGAIGNRRGESLGVGVGGQGGLPARREGRRTGILLMR